MPVSPARAAAFDILLRIESEQSYASELLHSAAYEKLSTGDHALTTELVMGVLRWRSRLDDEIARASSHPMAKLDIEILAALRLGLYQLRWLDRVPARAVIYESVELAKRARKRSAAPFVNAVLRKLATKRREAASEENTASPESLARALAHPAWLVARWARDYGLDVTRGICQHNQSIPQTAIRLRDPSAEAELRAEGIELAPGALLASARIVLWENITKTPAYRSGRVVIQDEASQLVAALVGRSSENLRILDCCAAPGGKTLAIADRNPHADMTAVELHPHRAQLLKRLSSRGEEMANHIRIVVADACRLPMLGNFNRVLADVPCSGTGTLARNPEIKWRLATADLGELPERQCKILCSALSQLAPGGRLIYSTCSLEREENEAVLERALHQVTRAEPAQDNDAVSTEGNSKSFIRENPYKPVAHNSFRLVDCAAELTRLHAEGELAWHDPVSLTRGPYLRTLPGLHPCDGFFAAILEKI